MVKSTYSDIIEEFGIPKITLWKTLNIISPQLKINDLKHLWYVIAVGDVKKERVREVIRLTPI